MELSYLRKEEQADLFAIMDEMDCTITPGHQKCARCPKPRLEGTAGQKTPCFHYEGGKAQSKEQFKIPKKKSAGFAPGTPTQKIEDTIVKALELYRKRQRSLEIVLPGSSAPICREPAFSLFPLSHLTPHYNLNSLKKRIWGG